MKKLLIILNTSILIFLVFSCEGRIGTPLANITPETRIFVSTPDSLLPDTVSSIIVLHWSGNDPDGEITGYNIRWNFDTSWNFTRDSQDTFFLPIRTQYDEFTFEAAAIDDDNQMDPTPAIQTFPVYNTPPEVLFRHLSNPLLPAGGTTYSFPVRSFVWDALDIDGNSTITNHYWCIDTPEDENAWQELPGFQGSITLENLTPGPHVFYLKTKDIAGAFSKTICYPDSGDSYTPDKWEVIQPSGDLLVVNDYLLDGQRDHLNFYRTQIESIPAIGNNYTVWEAGYGVPYRESDLLAALEHFNSVFWFSFLGESHYNDAPGAISTYLENGGHLLISDVKLDTSLPFFPLPDSLKQLMGRIPPGTEATPEILDFPILSASNLISNSSGLWYFGGNSGYEILYRYPYMDTWKGRPGIALLSDDKKFCYISQPLIYLNGNQNINLLLEKILIDTFNGNP